MTLSEFNLQYWSEFVYWAEFKYWSDFNYLIGPSILILSGPSLIVRPFGPILKDFKWAEFNSLILVRV